MTPPPLRNAASGLILILTPFIILVLVGMVMLVAVTYQRDAAQIAQQSQADLEALAAAEQMSQMANKLTLHNAALIQSYADIAHAASLADDPAKSAAISQAMAQIHLAAEFQDATLASRQDPKNPTAQQPAFQRAGGQPWLPILQTQPDRPFTPDRSAATIPASAVVQSQSENLLHPEGAGEAPGLYVKDFLPMTQRQARLISSTNPGNASR